jgi:hypothetical protein
MGQTTSAASLPSPEEGDPSDVAVALEAARALWENADTDEALRWFSRAAEAAEQAGNDRRALELARAVADLKDGLAAGAMPARSASKSVTPPPPPSARKSLPQAPPLVQLRPPPEASPAKSAPPPPSMRARPPEASPVAPLQVKPPSDPPPEPARVEKAAPSVAPPGQRVKLPYEEAETPATVEKGPPAAKPTIRTPGEESLRVSVKSSVRDPDLLIVRVLRRGQAVPSGCHEAFLSPAELGVDLRNIRG